MTTKALLREALNWLADCDEAHALATRIKAALSVPDQAGKPFVRLSQYTVGTWHETYPGDPDGGVEVYLAPPAYRAALLWVLWHHQGGSSPVGQPIRKVLGIERAAHLTPEQLKEAKAFDAEHPRTALLDP